MISQLGFLEKFWNKKKGNDEIHRLRHHSSLKLFLPTAENEKTHNLWIKLTFTKCQCQLDRQGWFEKKLYSSSWRPRKQNAKFILVPFYFVAENGRETRTKRYIRGLTFKGGYPRNQSVFNYPDGHSAFRASGNNLVGEFYRTREIYNFIYSFNR